MKAESETRFYLTNQEAEAVFDSHVAGLLELVNYDPIWGAVFNRVPDETGSNDAQRPAMLEGGGVARVPHKQLR
jgi:hypothetical protein